MSGLSRLGRASSGETAQTERKMPQSHPMERSVNAQLLSDSDTEYSPSPLTPSSEDARAPSSVELDSDRRRVQLQQPLDPYDDALICTRRSGDDR
jgi:hypothetical protein